MSLNTYPYNPFPASADKLDEIDTIKNGLINVNADVKLNTNDLTTLSRTKNLLNANIAEAKANNTTGTWSDNSYTESGVTFACTVDNAGYITNVHVTGTATAQVSFSLTKTFTLTEDTSYLLNGCPSGGTQSKYRVTIYTSVMDTQSTYGADKDFTYKAGNNPNAYIRIYSGYECPTAGLDFMPMVRLATETDSTFAPYIPSVDARLEAVESGAFTEIASITGDGVKTFGELLTELKSSIQNIGKYAILYYDIIYEMTRRATNNISFSNVVNDTNKTIISTITYTSASVMVHEVKIKNDGTITYTDVTSNVVGNGNIIKLVK